MELRRGDLVTVGHSGARSYDLVSTSNIIDWLDAEQRGACLSGLASLLAPGGMLLIRQANYHRGAELYPLRESLASSGLVVDDELSSAARRHERSLFFGGLVPRGDNLLVVTRG